MTTSPTRPAVGAGSGSASPPALSLTGLSFRYAGAGSAALAPLDLTVAAGEVLAVVGPSGSGKSTLLRLLSGLLPPAGGTVAIDGTDVTASPPERRPVAMVFQGFALFPHLSVRDNIGFGLRVRRVPAAARRARVDAAAASLGLTPLLDRLPSELSGGERQRTALARSLVRDPRVFCLDEPLSALDPVLRTGARRELDGVLRAEGRCAVWVTHDQAEAATVGDRVLVLRAGQVEQLGTVRELYDAPATTFVASFVGTPPMSLLPAAELAALAGGPFAGGPPPGAATGGVRAEHVLLGAGPELAVAGVEDLGHEVHVVLAAPGGGTLVARGPAGTRPGATARAAVDAAHVRWFRADGRAL